MSGKATGSGAKLEVSTDGTTWKQFASVTTISAPNMTRGTIDVTDLNSYSDNNQMKEYLVDFIESEDMTMEGFMKSEDEGRDAFETAFYNGSEVHLRLTLPPTIGKTMTVKGVPTAYRPVGDVNTTAGIGVSLGIKPTAKPTLAATTGS